MSNTEKPARPNCRSALPLYARRVTCPGSLIVHADGTIAGCTEDDEHNGCRGRDERHEIGPKRCIDWFGGCDYCGVHLD